MIPQAFPESQACYGGMTLRDYFAAQALIGMGTWTPNEPNGAPIRSTDRRIELQAWWAYKVADAMLAARTPPGDRVMAEQYLIWWTSQEDCERIAPLDTWPTYLYDEFQSRYGRNGRGRLWVPSKFKDAPDSVTIDWDTLTNWLCKAAEDAGGIVIKTEHVEQVQYLPGFVTTFAMQLPFGVVGSPRGQND